MNDIIKKSVKFLKNPKSLIIMGIIGILLIFLSTLGDGKTKKAEVGESFSAEEYKASLEADIKRLVKGITGSRKVTVVITLESGMNYSYAEAAQNSNEEKSDETKNEQKSETKQEYITVKNADGSEQAILISKQMPEIRGVAIVCEGGDNAVLNEKIQNAVTSALNITSKRVYIAGGN